MPGLETARAELSPELELTPDEAREVTNRIRQLTAMAWTCIVKAYNGRAWAALGYSTWDAYCETEFDGARLRLPREDRQEVVGSLRESGLSLRAIESATGVSRPTIINDLEVVKSLPPEQINGTDGKRYPTRDSEPRPEDLTARLSTIERAMLDRIRSGETVVVNMRAGAHEALWVYAEWTGMGVRIDRKSEWGNPFVLPGDGTRDEVCDNFIEAYWPLKSSLHGQVASLRGKALGCWCAPLRCHGDFLASEADR